MENTAESAPVSTPTSEAVVENSGTSQEAPASTPSPESSSTSTNDGKVTESGTTSETLTPAEQYAAIQAKFENVEYRLTDEEIDFLEHYKPEVAPEGQETAQEGAEEAGKPAGLTEDISKAMDILGVKDAKELPDRITSVLEEKNQEIQAKETRLVEERQEYNNTAKGMNTLMAGLRKGDPNAIAIYDQVMGNQSGANGQPPVDEKATSPFNREELMDSELAIVDFFESKVSKLEKMVHQLTTVHEAKQAEVQQSQQADAARTETLDKLCTLADQFSDIGVSSTQVRDGFKTFWKTEVVPASIQPIIDIINYAEDNDCANLTVAYKAMKADKTDVGKIVNEKVHEQLAKKMKGPVTEHTLAGLGSKKLMGVSTEIQAINAKIKVNPLYRMTNEELEIYMKGN